MIEYNVVKCSKNELNTTAINTEKDDDKINILSKTRNNVFLLIMKSLQIRIRN